MIKNILYLCLLPFLVMSCEQKESFLYDSKDGLYFTLPRTSLHPWDTETPEEFNKTIDFAFRKTGKMDAMYMYNLYYGDSLRTDTLRLIVAVAGNATDQNREYSLKSEALSDTLNLAEVQFFNPYCIEAGQTRDTATVVVTRTFQRGITGANITFDIENSPAFASSIYGWNSFHLNVSDRYPKPDNWDEEKYGKYSEEKYAFWVTVMETTYENESLIFDSNWTPLDIVAKLNKALKEYNTAHPENPKDFTFPGYDDEEKEEGKR